MHTRRFLTALIFSGALFTTVLPAMPQNNASVFTVADSIQMTTFSDPYTRTPNAEAKEAPDGTGYFVVTTRGMLKNNLLESSLWYFTRSALEHYVSGTSSTPPPPRLLYRTRGRIRSFQSNSYGSLITEGSWSEDSRHIDMLVEFDNSHRHLLSVDVATGRYTDVTPNASGDIRAFAQATSSITYLEHSVETPKRTEHDQYSAEISLTGKSLLQILFPTTDVGAGALGESWQLHVQTGSAKPLRYTVPFPTGAAYSFRPSMSPERTHIIIAVAATVIPDSWTSYRSVSKSFNFRMQPSPGEHPGQLLTWPWQYAILDLRTKSLHALWEAPAAWTAGYANAQQASWSNDGRQVLLTNTFLPLSDENPRLAGTIKPCAIAVYSLQKQTGSCVVLSKLPETAAYLREAHFEEDGSRIVSSWLSDGNNLRIEYANLGGQWKQTATTKSVHAGSKLRLVLHQDLTVPPVLWVESDSRMRPLWNPNPQLSSKILAKGDVLHWKDSSGHEWKGALLLPSTPKLKDGYPLVVQTHGFYNEHEFMPDGSFTTGFAAQPLAGVGIAVLQMEDRSDRRGLPPVEEPDTFVRGVLSALDYLGERRLIDPSRVGIIGFSRTHWYVEKALEAAPCRFRAASLIDGIDESYFSDLVFATESSLARQEHDAANDGPPFGTSLNRWLEHSVGFNLDKVKAAVRLEAITKPSVLDEWETYSILRQQGKAVDLVEIPNGQHILQNPWDRYASQQGTVEWFRYWLQGYQLSNGADKNEYQRWERMRERQNTASLCTSDSNGH